MDAFGGWVFPSMRVSPGYILCHNFVGMLSILLHVDFNCIFIAIIMGYVETVIFRIVKFPYNWYQSYGFIIVTLD